jgi:hypothetical protein
MKHYLKDPIKIQFTKIFLDPNNPRIAPSEGERPGYDEPARIFDKEVQTNLEKRVEEVYKVEELEPKIVAQGWVPIDNILVWDHPKKKGHYIVLEGNTRTVVLRRIRDRLEKEKAKLERMNERKKSYAAKDLDEQGQIVNQLDQIVKDTDQLTVYPVDAKTPEELEEKLPRLMGVRHITHAQQWSPYALNLYILSLYRRMFYEKHKADTDLKLEDDLIKKVAAEVSLPQTKTRRNIQSASAFSHFKRRYEDRLPSGERFSDEDQYFFELILQNELPREQFEFAKTDLQLSEEMEEVLFKWAFQLPRNDGDENPNVLYKAESLRLWNQMKRYDNSKGTTFAGQLNVADPDSATPVKRLEAEFLAHKAQVSPVETVQSLLDSFRNLKVDTLMSQASHLKPMLEEFRNRAQNYLKMLDAVES